MNPWDDEPDKFDADHIAIRRNPLGALSGYIGIPDSHPLFGKVHNDVIWVPPETFTREIDLNKAPLISLLLAGEKTNEEDSTTSLDCAFAVHGGITWAHDYVPLDEPDGLWWFGFDCAHAGDYIPSWDYRMKGDVYRDIEYVKKECASLAKQLVDYAAIHRRLVLDMIDHAVEKDIED